ncbi:MAG TPA: hypothetical protein VL475_14070 [Planctomycetaceae bacterium]|jgi:hypothetical protein|nr:hypothetical protein [Planctomycetaceae bacterium]
MCKTEIAAVALLSLSLWGCVESTDQKSESSRTGAVGVTTQDIDDLAKPVGKPKEPPAGLYDNK